MEVVERAGVGFKISVEIGGAGRVCSDDSNFWIVDIDRINLPSWDCFRLASVERSDSFPFLSDFQADEPKPRRSRAE